MKYFSCFPAFDFKHHNKPTLGLNALLFRLFLLQECPIHPRTKKKKKENTTSQLSKRCIDHIWHFESVSIQTPFLEKLGFFLKSVICNLFELIFI